MRVLAAIVVAALLAVGVAIFFYSGTQTPVEAPVVESSQSDAEREQLEQALAESQARVAKLEADAKALEAEMKATAAEKMATEEETPEPEGEAEPEEPTKPESPTLDTIRNQIKENPTAAAQVKAMAEMAYGDFINALELEPDVKARVREMLSESYMENLALSQYAMATGDKTWAEVKSWHLDERAFLTESLRSVLPEEDHEMWDAYVADFEVRELDGSLRNQIRAFSSGLTDENFEMVMDVAVDEFRAEQIALEQSDELFTMQENVRYQLRAMEQMRGRLEGAMDEAQIAELENFLTMAENVLSGQLSSMEAAQQ